MSLPVQSPFVRVFTKQRSSRVKYALDVVLTQLIILPLAILSWRSLWLLYDNFWFPSN